MPKAFPIEKFEKVVIILKVEGGYDYDYTNISKNYGINP